MVLHVRKQRDSCAGPLTRRLERVRRTSPPRPAFKPSVWSSHDLVDGRELSLDRTSSAVVHEGRMPPRRLHDAFDIPERSHGRPRCRFSRHSAISHVSESGTDARFPSDVRQFVDLQYPPQRCTKRTASISAGRAFRDLPGLCQAMPPHFAVRMRCRAASPEFERRCLALRLVDVDARARLIDQRGKRLPA